MTRYCITYDNFNWYSIKQLKEFQYKQLNSFDKILLSVQVVYSDCFNWCTVYSLNDNVFVLDLFYQEINDLQKKINSHCRSYIIKQMVENASGKFTYSFVNGIRQTTSQFYEILVYDLDDSVSQFDGKLVLHIFHISYPPILNCRLHSLQATKVK